MIFWNESPKKWIENFVGGIYILSPLPDYHLFAVKEQKNGPLTPEGEKLNVDNNYEPTVTVKTFMNPPSGGRGAKVVITVSDNGNGIPPGVADKIFQPFFSTKPTGQGTGLGLSLSYDIVKSHGGEISVESKEGKGTDFLVELPVI